MVKLLQGPLPPTKELLKKMIELEQSQEHLMQEMSRLKVSTEGEPYPGLYEFETTALEVH
ncbi:unnamed protein product [Arabidopsis halleri]